MNDATYHMERDLSAAYHDAARDITAKHHIDPHSAATMREYVAMITAGEFEGSKDDKFLDSKISKYDHPAHYINLRKHEADHAGHEAEIAKLKDAYRAAQLAIKTSQDHDKTRVETVEKFRKTWLH